MHIVLDLDETLIHVSTTPIFDKPDFTFSINGLKYYGRRRPGLEVFLKYVFSNFDTVSVWTAGVKQYAQRVIDKIMTPTQRKQLAFFYTRANLSVMSNGMYNKPLETIFMTPKAQKMGIKHDNTIMVDDRGEVLQANPGNGIEISSWTGHHQDRCLWQLIIIIDGLLKNNFKVGHFPSTFKLHELCN
jgi:carboxy-terminal domain RNA polymerase II polypeptide A small phosphatase